MSPDEVVEAIRVLLLDAAVLLVGDAGSVSLHVDHAGGAASFRLEAGEGKATARLVGKDGLTVQALRRLAKAIGRQHGLTVDVDVPRR